MSDHFLRAALYLNAVLPVAPWLALRDLSLAAALAGPDVAVALSAPGGLRARLSVVAGRLSWSRDPEPGDTRLWFPSAKQLVRALEDRTNRAFALPLGGFAGLGRARRLLAAGRRLSCLLEQRSPAHLALHTWGRFAIALRAATVWLRMHPDGPGEHARLGRGIAVFDCPQFPRPLWIDLGLLDAGNGPPGSPATVRVTFANLPTALAELDRQLDAPAAIGLGDLRVEGHLPFADHLGLVLERAGAALRPPPTPLAGTDAPRLHLQPALLPR